MNKLDKYLGISTDLENRSVFLIEEKPDKEKEEIYYFRQLINSIVIFLILFFIIYIVLKEYTYDYVTIRRAGINSRTLCENIPDDILY